MQRNWQRFGLRKFYRISIYVITVVKFSNRPIQNLLNLFQRTSMDFGKVDSRNKILKILKINKQNSQNPAIFLEIKHVNQKRKQGFPMMGI